MKQRPCGQSGLTLSELTLGLWHNFGDATTQDQCKKMIATALDLGITAFDLADNYGPPPGAAETLFGATLKAHFAAHRDEMVITTKAGHLMWPGPYGDGGSRKHLIAGINQSLRRLQLDYVDIFYHHRPDPNTPLEESLGALADIVRSGKALYVGISKYSAADTQRAIAFFKETRTPFVINQHRYSLFVRDIEREILPLCTEQQVGVTVFSTLAQGLLTDKYLREIPVDSRMASQSPFLNQRDLTPERLNQIADLNQLALDHGYTLAQMALLWTLRHPIVCSAIIGARTTEQLRDNAAALDLPPLPPSLLEAIG